MSKITPRTGQGKVDLSKEEFSERFRKSFPPSQFGKIEAELNRVVEAAWNEYNQGIKSPESEQLGEGYDQPEFEFSTDWIRTAKRLKEAETAFADPALPRMALVINASPRSDNTCPGEMSKSHRLCKRALETLQHERVNTVYLDLSRLASEYGKKIFPCKGCVSTSMALCHWPCSCYPNHALGQTQDWMNEIYELWVRAHGVLIISPVHWYSPPSSLKLMMDRMVCADGGNPDPSTTHGKDAKLAKKLELSGWGFPRHLAGRKFAVVTHGDAEGAGRVRDTLCNWLEDIGLESAGRNAVIDRYLGYYEPYATSHHALDQTEVIFQEVEFASKLLAKSLVDAHPSTRSEQQNLNGVRPK